MAVDIRFIIDGLDIGQPLNAQDFGLTINEVVEINARIVSFDNELIFGGDVYSNFYSRLNQSGFCNLVKVNVHYNCSGNWHLLTDGYIVLSECSFDIDKNQVKTKLYDESFSTKINNNKGIPFSLSNGLSKNLEPVSIAPSRSGRFFFPSTGGYSSGITFGVTVYDAFKYLVSCMSDNLVDFESSLFAFDQMVSDEFILVTNGDAVKNQSASETVVSFDTLYIALKKKYNLGMQFEKQSNGRPLLRIELSSYFFQATPSAILDDQSGIDMTFDKARLYQAVEFGSEPMLEKEQCGNGSLPCSFIQTPFRGFRNETFGFTGECNTSTILPLSSSDVVFDTNVIEDVFVNGNEDYKRTPFIVSCDWFASSQDFMAKQYDPYSNGGTVYNGNFRNIVVSNNWIDGYPNSLYSFLTAPFDPATTVSQSNISNDAQVYPLGTSAGDTGIWFRYSAYAGNWLKFLTETDPFNLFDGESYTCPHLGTYTVDSRVCFGYLEPLEIGNRGRQYETIISHLNGAGVVIEEFFHSPAGDFGNADQFMTFSKTFICNAGDKIRIDARVKYAFAINLPPSQRFLDNCVVGTTTYYSYFNVSGTPLNPDNPEEELQPVNIEDVRAYLYKFERPLSMAEVASILSNTNNPILFGIFDDPLRVIPGFIKTVNVNSLMRKFASFELKSNKLLR